MRLTRGAVAVAASMLLLAVGAAPAGAARPDVPQAVSCPSVSLCVAVDDDGMVLTSTNPTGGASAWKTARVAAGFDLPGVSCASIALCVAYDQFGDVVTSTNPTGGVHAWTATERNSDDLAALSCPSGALCVGVSGSTVVTSTNPTGGASAWTAITLPGRHGMSSVSCASSTLCVAADLGGNVATSTNPAGGAAAWTIAPVGNGNFWMTVSCVLSTLCMTLDGAGNAATSTNPTGGTGAWTTVRGAPFLIPPGVVTCPSVALCVAAGGTDVATTTNPTGGLGAWRNTTVDRHGGDLHGLSCPSISLCVAVDANGNVVTSTNPAGGASTWTTAAFDRHSHVIPRSDLLLGLKATLDELGQDPRLRAAALRKSRSYSQTFFDLDTGSLRVGWYDVPPGAHLATSTRKPILVASGRSSVPDTGDTTVTVRLTATGRKLLAHASSIKLRAKATLTLTVGKPVTATDTFTLKR